MIFYCNQNVDKFFRKIYFKVFLSDDLITNLKLYLVYCTVGWVSNSSLTIPEIAANNQPKGVLSAQTPHSHPETDAFASAAGLQIHL